MMKKLFILFLILTFLIAVPVQAADMSVRVTSSEGSIYFRSNPSKTSRVLSEIPNGTVLHITELAYSSGDDLIFGLTTYSGTSGWVSLRQTSITSFNGFNTTVASSEGYVNFRASASKGSSLLAKIPNGTSLYISDMYYNSSNDLFFGKTTYNGTSGWISLRHTTLDASSASPAASPEPAAAPQPVTTAPQPVTASEPVPVSQPATSPQPVTTSEPSAAPSDDSVIIQFDTGAAANPGNTAATATGSALYRNYSYNFTLSQYENVERNMDGTRGYEYIYPEERIRFTSIDDGQPGDYASYDDWPHYAVIEHYDENGSVIWSITTESVYCLNGGYSPIGASPDTFFYTNYDDIFAIDIATGSPVWTVPNQLGGHDGGFRGKAVGKAGEVYICVTSGGNCMVINSKGEVVHVDDKSSGSYFGANLVFTDISYSGNNMISVTARNEDGQVNQFLISQDDL